MICITRIIDVREVLQGLLYVLEKCRQWRKPLKDFPPRSTIWEYFDLLRYDGTLDRIHEMLYLALRETDRRDASPNAAIIDSRTVKSAEKRGCRRQETGFDAGKKTKGIKEHLLVDTLGLMLRIVIHPASIQDRDGAALVMNRRIRRRFAFIEVVLVDQGYSGAKAADAISRTGKLHFEIVRREPGTKGFEVLPKRWIVEHTLSWIRRNR